MNTAIRLFLCTLFIAATPHPLGWKSAPKHARGLTQIRNHVAFRAAPLPAKASVKDQMPEVYDQLNIGSCVAQSGVAAFDANWKSRTGRYANASRLDLYQSCLKFDGVFPRDYGTYTSTALKVLVQRGVLLESKWPYRPENLDKNPTPAGRQRATYAAVKVFDVPNTDNGYSVKQAIANSKLPVIIGGYVYNDIFDESGSHVPMPRGNPVGGHAMVVVGYDDNMTWNGLRGFVEVRNSWGKSWKNGGYAWFPYAYVFNPRYMEDFGAVEATGKRLKPASSPVRGQSTNKSPQRKKSGFIEPKKVFIGPTALLEEIDGQRKWRLMRDVVYRTERGEIITARQGLITDLASVPRCVWSIFPPWSPTYGRAAIIHDQLYRTHGAADSRRYTRKESDQVFLSAMRDLGASRLSRNTIYLAVRAGNPEWPEDRNRATYQLN